MNTRHSTTATANGSVAELKLAVSDTGVTHAVHHAHDAPPNAAPHSPRLRWRRFAIVTAVVATIAYQGTLRRPTGPDAGTWFHVPAATAQDGNDTLRIGTFNMHGGKGVDGVRDLTRIAETLRGLDFAGLNEVHGGVPFRGEDQAAALGQQLGMPWLYAPTEQRWWCDRFGNGALSNLPVTSWQRIPLARAHGKSYRNAVLVRAEHQGKPVNIVVTHLDRSDDRERVEQLRTVGELFLALESPAILLGDLNTDDTEPALRKLLDAPGVHDPLRDRLGDGAPRRIDWILVRGLETIDAGIVNRGDSDHPHVWAELAWPEE
ncbi:MAG: endonuclease/exonuclease/phosphatase family protein [Planctomycetia bacterium]|nr:endonuclease/exonuclease/phosphatase family protein [Planctomycetia bacterium]